MDAIATTGLQLQKAAIVTNPRLPVEFVESILDLLETQRVLGIVPKFRFIKDFIG